MHTFARDFCARTAQRSQTGGRALDIGGRDINGTCRDLWPLMEWWIIDKNIDNPSGLEYGFNGTVNKYDYTTGPYQYDFFDFILCTEVLEHEEQWTKIIAHAYQDLRAGGGTLVLTCAGPYRNHHSAIDGAELRVGEYYKNIDPMLLYRKCIEVGFAYGELTYHFGNGREDLYLIATKNPVTLNDLSS